MPVLERLGGWLDKTQSKSLPKSTLGKALAHLNKNFVKLYRYTEDGRLRIDNNAVENAILPFVPGRKNWLFIDTPKGAKARSALYSVIETGKLNRLGPHVYLDSVYSSLPQAETLEAIEALLPWNARAAVSLEALAAVQGRKD